MRIATYNVEWFNSLFDDEGGLLVDDELSARYKVTRAEQIEALGIVFTALNADAVMVIEAPDNTPPRSTVRALEAFASAFDLRARKALIGFSNHTQQEISLLYDPDVFAAVHDPRGEETGKKGSSDAPRFDAVYRRDLDVDAHAETVRFSKPPLEVELKTHAGQILRLIGVHVKSKAPHGAKGPHEIMRISIDNRRKQLAQCLWLRQRAVDHLNAGDSLILLGDLNDGPGLDEYEKLFGRSGVEILLGDDDGPPMFDPHALMHSRQRFGASPTSARFYMKDTRRYMQALLDYIMVSPDLRDKSPSWRIWHPLDDPGCLAVPELAQSLLVASDHFPVSLDLKL